MCYVSKGSRAYYIDTKKGELGRNDEVFLKAHVPIISILADNQALMKHVPRPMRETPAPIQFCTVSKTTQTDACIYLGVD